MTAVINVSNPLFIFEISHVYIYINISFVGMVESEIWYLAESKYM